MRLYVPGLLVGWLMCQADMAGAQSVVRTDTLANRMNQTPKVLIKKPKPLRTELSAGARLNTNGWSIFVNKGYVKQPGKETDQFFNLNQYEVEFSEVKHPKEIKHTNTALAGRTNDKPKAYIFGKINNFYTFKLGYGQRRLIAGKPEPGNVSVHWFATAGLSLGLLKPYYLDAYVQQDQGTYARQTVKYGDSAANAAFVNDEMIIGSAGFSKGLGEIKIVPGGHFKGGLHFDFAPRKKTVLAIEAGFNAEIYSKKIEMMIGQKAVPYNLNIFAGIQFGKRW